MGLVAGAAAAVLLLAGDVHAAGERCRVPPADRSAVDSTIAAFFDALKRDDAKALGKVTTGSFRAFDAGKRFTAAELGEVVRQAHRQGVQLNWNVGRIDTRVGCGTAWSSWENAGSVGVPPKLAPVRWLESAVLVKEGGAWKIDFFHSSRVPPATETRQ
jgi:hypothetical protein